MTLKKAIYHRGRTKRGRKEQRQTKKQLRKINRMAISTSLPIITLNVSGLKILQSKDIEWLNE